MSADTQTEGQPAVRRRIIKRYSNRKLYDTTESRYVTLAQIADLVRAGEEVQVIDNATKEDKTEATLALILSEEVKTRPKAVPLGALRELVHTRGEKLISQLREGPARALLQPKRTKRPSHRAMSPRRRPRPQPRPLLPPPRPAPPVTRARRADVNRHATSRFLRHAPPSP